MNSEALSNPMEKNVLIEMGLQSENISTAVLSKRALKNKAQKQNAPLGLRKGKFSSKNHLQEIQDDQSSRKVKTCLLKKEKELQKVVLPSAKTFQKKFKKPLFVNTYMQMDNKHLDYGQNSDISPIFKSMPQIVLYPPEVSTKYNKHRNSKWLTLSSNSKHNDRYLQVREACSPSPNRVQKKSMNVRQQKAAQFSKEEITKEINQITKQILNELSGDSKIDNKSSEHWLTNHFESLKLIQSLLTQNSSQKKDAVCEQKDNLIQLQRNEICELNKITKIQNTIQESLLFNDLEIDQNIGSPKLQKNQSIFFNFEKMEVEQSPKVRYALKSDRKVKGQTQLKLEKNQIEENLDDTSESETTGLEQSSNDEFAIQLSNIKKYKKVDKPLNLDLMMVDSNTSQQNSVIVEKDQNIQKIIKNYNQKDFKNLFANLSQKRKTSVQTPLIKQSICKSERRKSINKDRAMHTLLSMGFEG